MGVFFLNTVYIHCYGILVMYVLCSRERTVSEYVSLLLYTVCVCWLTVAVYVSLLTDVV